MRHGWREPKVSGYLSWVSRGNKRRIISRILLSRQRTVNVEIAPLNEVRDFGFNYSLVAGHQRGAITPQGSPAAPLKVQNLLCNQLHHMYYSAGITCGSIEGTLSGALFHEQCNYSAGITCGSIEGILLAAEKGYKAQLLRRDHLRLH